MCWMQCSINAVSRKAFVEPPPFPLHHPSIFAGPVFGAYTKCFKDFKDEKTCRRESTHAMLCNKGAWDKASYRCGDRFLKYQLSVHEDASKEEIDSKQKDFRQCMLRDDLPMEH